MKAFFRPSIWLLISSLNLLVAADSYFFNNTEGLGPNAANVSAGCVTALRAEIPCNNHFITLMTSDSYAPLGNKTIQDIFCNSTCSTGLATYRSAVVSACSKDVQPLPGLPATWWVDSATSAFKQFCLKDTTTGNYCTDILPSLTNNENAETPITDLPVATLCSTCVISLFRQMQSTSYSNYDPNLAIIWGDVQAKCQLSYPTDVLPLDTNVTTPGGFAAPGTGFTGCLTGETYTVVSGDNCNAIAQSQSVSVGTLIAINNLYTDCRNLWAGATLCLPPKCTLYQVQSGDTCDKIANLTSTSFQQLTAWNPAINSYCTNLIAGQAICASPPGGEVSMTTIPGATTTQTGIYASATVDRPNAVASGTTRFCGKYYLVMPGDFCQLVVVNNTITLDLFLAINPSIDAACSNLLLGVNYCVRPTEQWNGTSSTIVDPPAATPPGSTPECYEWYTVVSGDWCGKITDTYSITMAQLQFWNPDLKSDCSNLLLDEAYCVHGVFDLTTTTAAGAKAKRTAPAAGGAPVPRETGGGVPYGWPGLGAPRVQDGIGKARREL